MAAALTDLSAMVEWSGAAAVTVIERTTPAGRPGTLARELRTAARRVRAAVQVGPRRCQLVAARGRILKRENGRYQLDALGGGRTRVTYSLEIGIGMPVPACIRRRVESILIEATLKALKTRP